MAQKTIHGSKELAKKIKLRRNELNFTIEEAALRAGVGTKTWSRYEAGESIRRDKCKGICKALNWHKLPDQDMPEDESVSMQEYKDHEAWSRFLESQFGVGAAMSFAEGSNMLLDSIKEDMSELASMPIGTHIGQLNVSQLSEILPKQFLMHYDYEFLYQMACSLREMRRRAKNGLPMTAHCVMEELILYLCCEESSAWIELGCGIHRFDDSDDAPSKEWLFDLFGDMDIISCLYSNVHLDANHSYHFSHWASQQFCTD